MAAEINPEYISEIEIMMNKVSEKIELYLKSIKEKSINEIINGSIPKAQEILDSILPIQQAMENLTNAQTEFLNLIKTEKIELKESPKAELRVLSSVKSEQSQNINRNILKAGILKSLIYLGGNADIKDITEFVKHEIKKVNTTVKPFTENDEHLKKYILDESYKMLKEGFVIEDNLSKKWEILPSGIDFLSKYDIAAKAKVN